MPEKNTRSPQPAPPHDLILESRARLTVTGVQKVLHCNADSAAIETGRGILHLAGAQLSMAALDLEAGEAKFTEDCLSATTADFYTKHTKGWEYAMAATSWRSRRKRSSTAGMWSI